MKTTFHIPRFSLAWVLVSLVAVILPHTLRMPFWLTLMCGFCVFGRILIFQGKMAYPGKLLKASIVIAMFVSMIIQYGRQIISIDATIAILIGSLALKLLEMERKRDILLVIYLCYFSVIGEFIYSQSIPVALYMSLCVLLITSAMMSLNQTQSHQSPKRTLKLSGIILLQSIPLMMVLFVFFPRMAPLWYMPVQSNSGVTGLSDNMGPGDIGELISSADVAFRVQFTEEPPPNGDLYWRGVTLDSFTGREWRRGFNLTPQFLEANASISQDWYNTIEYLDNVVEYNIIMEPTFQNWIYTLKVPQIQDERFLMRRDYQIDAKRRVDQRLTYDASSYLNNRIDLSLTEVQQRRMIALPFEGNEASREFAISMRQEAGSDEAFVTALLTYFRNEEFFYTLSPSLLNVNSIDDFLFNTREGFCEHYASTFTYLMRAAGVPARVVTGYQGGEFNPYDDTLTVRQYDAHAWSEVWLEGAGWTRFDPTAAVSPDRIDLGSQITLQEEESFLENVGFSMLRFRSNLMLNDIRYRLEMIDYSWNKFVLNYDQAVQFELFRRLFNAVGKMTVVLTVLGVIFFLLVVMVLLILGKSSRRKEHPATLIYRRYCQYLAKLGFERSAGETPQNYYQRISKEQPQWAPAMSGITSSYIDIIYKKRNDDHNITRKINHLKRLVRKFRLTN